VPLQQAGFLLNIARWNIVMDLTSAQARATDFIVAVGLKREMRIVNRRPRLRGVFDRGQWPWGLK
jgi:hypothetical protein